MNDFLKVVKSLKNVGLLIKDFRETFENEPKEQKGGFLSMLLSSLGASLLENLLTGKEFKRLKIPGWRVMREVKGTIRQGQDF